MRSSFLLYTLVLCLVAGCASLSAPSDVRQRESFYNERLSTLPRQATRDQLERTFSRLRHVSPPREPESDSILTGTEVFRIDADFVLEVKFMYAAPYRIAAGATRLGATAAADEGPSAWQIFGFVREAVRGPWVESPQDEILSTRLRRVTRAR